MDPNKITNRGQFNLHKFNVSKYRTYIHAARLDCLGTGITFATFEARKAWSAARPTAANNS